MQGKWLQKILEWVSDGQAAAVGTQHLNTSCSIMKQKLKPEAELMDQVS